MESQRGLRKLISAVATVAMTASLLVAGSGAAHADSDAPVVVDNAFGQLYFDYSNHTNITPSPGTNCLSAAPCTGKAVGDQVLFQNV